MPAPAHLISFAAHDSWANSLILTALGELPAPPPIAVREMAHVLGAHETWLARIEGRVPLTPVWPDLALKELTPLGAANGNCHRAMLDRLTQTDLEQAVHYTNSTGASFTTALGDILIHVALHAQYHRGKVNVALREAGLAPVPTDYITFVRGTAAAATGSTGGRG